MRDYIDERENLAKLILRSSIVLDIFIYAGFFFGFVFGIAGAEIGFWLLGFVFRYGVHIGISSVILKIVVIILSYKKDTYKKRELLSVALSSMVLLFIIGAIVWGIYYIGKIMTAVG